MIFIDFSILKMDERFKNDHIGINVPKPPKFNGMQEIKANEQKFPLQDEECEYDEQ